MAKEKKLSLLLTCIICRKKISSKVKVSDDDGLEFQRWKLTSLEAVSLMFALPADHSFTSMFFNSGSQKANLCDQCFQDSMDAQFVFWQLQNLEKSLEDIQNRILQKLKLNYKAVPVTTLFTTTVGDADIRDHFDTLTYDQIVKLLFESIRNKKESWPKSFYAKKWNLARENANKNLQTARPPSTDTSEDNTDLASGETESVQNVDNSNEKAGVSRKELPCNSYNSFAPSPLPLPTASLTLTLNAIKESKIQPRAKRRRKLSKWSTASENDSWSHEDEDDNWTRSIKNNVQNKKDGNWGRAKSTKRKMRPPAAIKALEVTENGVPLYECMEQPETCNSKFTSVKQLQIHIRKGHTTEAVTSHACDHEGCTKLFQSIRKLEIHKKQAHSKICQKGVEVCEVCGVKVPDLKKHYYLKHIGVGIYKCDICAMDFNDSELFKDHQVLHTKSEFPFSCVVCKMLFTNSLDLKAHVSSNHLSSGLKCEKCGIMKPNEYLLRRHMKIHDRAKDFVCECGKAFKTKGYLNYHIDHFHTNAGMTFPCEICGKTFLHSKNAARHLVTHRKEKPFKCQICSKTFNYSHLLKKHEEIHSGTKNYGCEICGKRFRQEQNLTQHMRSHLPKQPKSTSKKPVRKPKTPSTITTDISEKVPVILEVKTDTSGTKREAEIEVCKDPIVADEKVTTATFTLPEESSTTQLGTVHEIRQIQINHGDSDIPSQTATVVFVTTNSNFQWITQ